MSRAFGPMKRISGIRRALRPRSPDPCCLLSVYHSGWVTCNPRSLHGVSPLRTHEPDATFISYPQAEIEEAAARATEEILLRLVGR